MLFYIGYTDSHIRKLINFLEIKKKHKVIKLLIIILRFKSDRVHSEDFILYIV